MKKNTALTFYDCMTQRGIKNNATITNLEKVNKNKGTQSPGTKCGYQNFLGKLKFNVDLGKDWTEAQFGSKGKTLEEKLEKCKIDNFKLAPVTKGDGNRVTFDIKTPKSPRAILPPNGRHRNLYLKEEKCVSDTIWDAKPSNATLAVNKVSFECRSVTPLRSDTTTWA
jgi:hypothetical protein